MVKCVITCSIDYFPFLSTIWDIISKHFWKKSKDIWGNISKKWCNIRLFQCNNFLAFIFKESYFFIKKDSFDNVFLHLWNGCYQELRSIKYLDFLFHSIKKSFPTSTFLETKINKNLVIGNKVLNQCHSCNVQKNYLNKNLSGEMIDSENYRKKRDFNFWSDWVSPKIILATLLSWIFFFDWKFIHMLLCR